MVSTAVVFSPPLSAAETPTSIKQYQIQYDSISRFPNRSFEPLKSCRTLPDTKQVHCQLAKSGLLLDSVTLSNLIIKYSEFTTHESLEYALKAFNVFKHTRNDLSTSGVAFLYNYLIRASTSVGAFRRAILLFVDMLISGVTPDNYTFPYVLSACTKGLRLSESEQIHGAIVKMGSDSNAFVSNSLVYCYGECGKIDIAQKVFDKMPERNVVSWTSLICGYARRDRHKEAVSLFFEMADEGIEPNEVTLVSVISACAGLKDMKFGKRVLDYVGGSVVRDNVYVMNALVDMYMKCGAEHKARQLFKTCDEKNLELYNTVMSNYVKLGKVEEAIGVFEELLDEGMKPDRVTMLSVITSAIELGDSSLGMQTHAYAIRNGLESWDSVANALLDMYAKCGRQEWAYKVFHRMPNKTLVSWNSLLAGYARNGDVETAQRIFDNMLERDIVSWNTMIGVMVQNSYFRDAIELFNSMQNERIMADEVTMVSVASACGYLGAFDLARWIHNYIEKNGIHCNLRLSTALVDMFARCGDPDNAMMVFDSMKERDVSAWTAAMGAMAMEGNGQRAVELFNEMRRQGITPDEIVFSTVLTACSRSGLVKQGMHIFKSIGQYGMTPHIIHYGCIVDLLGRAGLLGEALEFIRSMPVEPNSIIWGSFLSACKVHKNEKMATHAAEMVTKSSNDRAGLQVLLSNIYASVGQWDDVAKVRLHMREQGMKKTPGSSSIEVNGVVHEFTSGCESHPQNGLTASMLDEIILRIKDAGYVPNLDNVLLDIDEQEKQFMLSRHSEKMAIAFGLVSSAKGTPVRVIKNLRMCSDCHSFAKMVSAVYNRVIIVRDNNRFHFFRQGWCSCNDFW